MLETYQKVRALSSQELCDLRLRLSYPWKFWKLVNHYSNNNKVWISGKNVEKLEQLQQQYGNWQHFLKNAFQSFHFSPFCYIMMLGSKGILPPMIHGLLRISCSRNPKNIRNPPYSGCFLMFYGSQSHAFSCKHETHNLLTLISYNLINGMPGGAEVPKKTYQNGGNINGLQSYL